MSIPHTPVGRILWAAPFCLHDTSSGAAIEIKTMFEQLAKKGVECQVVSAFTFDAPNGTAMFPKLEEETKAQDKDWFNIDDNGIKYSYFKTKSKQINDMTRSEESKFYSGYLAKLNEFKPDVIHLFGGSPLELAIMWEAKRRGIGVVMGVHNGNYASSSFPTVDMIITPSATTAQNYKNKSRTNMLPTGIFIDPKKAVAQKKDPKYITFINPHSSKGVSLVMRLALMAKKKYPQWKFLIVESRGTWAQAIATFKQKPADFTNVDIAKHTTDIRSIFEKTKLLLAPSLCYEAFGRVAIEAVLNSIPVLASKSGGLGEAVNGGGMNLATPEKCTKDFNYFPQAKEMDEWFKALEEMMNDKNYKNWCKKAKEASKAHDIELSTARTLGYLKPLFDRKPSYNIHYFQ